MSMPKVSALSLAVTAAVACGGCASYSKLDPGTTLGKIEVSGVRVSSRERMVNERLKRREFLESQLTAAQALKSLSEFLCLRHNVSPERKSYAKEETETAPAARCSVAGGRAGVA
ncbi:MAG: hypothetical protein PHW25_20290, partial [Zoogloea sp.]|uniref:hypothetical protein n=1 Tax=Zoogloea sp. TaxID=49181 RepID=UPI002638FC1A